ncbi:hypothetical protein [uncultured Ilyobacter sp.]|uniref:hypothetical protein n=1 Tax=uncultured Ilyobacter sp. TaxID=544433 RepID=UPI0029F54E81|nr:hypothetical protein [uncultured Ilyobacter sp.]
MDTMDVLEILKEKKIDLIENIINEKGRNRALDYFGEFLDCRSYFTIDRNGKIQRKNMNYALPVAAFSNDDAEVAKEILVSAKAQERVKAKKIERLSKETIDDLMKNFMKIIANNNVNFAVRYAKEIFLRDRELFYKTLFHYTLLEEIDSQKSLMALSLKRLMNTEVDDKLIYLAMSYISKVKGNFNEYENIFVATEIPKSDLIKKSQESKEMLKSKRGVSLLAYINVLKEYEYENEEIFINIAMKRLEEIKNTQKNLTCAENIIHNGL